MATGAVFANITPKRILGDTDLGDRLLTYLRDSIREQAARVYASGGTYGPLALAADGNDQFQITGTALAADGLGHILDPAQGAVSGIQFENTSAIDYYVGLSHCEKPSEVAANPRNGLPEYTAFADEIGEAGTPDAVTDNGGTITFTVDSVTETGVDNTGRQVLVYKATPATDALTEAIAIETATVAYTGGFNQITTSGTLGQSAVSTTAADYVVILLGPSVKRNTDLRNSSTHAFVGIVTGAGAGNPPTTFDTSDQQEFNASIPQLNEITRVASNGRLKIDVKAIAGETAEDQVRVTDSTGTVRFQVDEAGNVVIDGDLEVKGETTQRDVVQVISSETITENLTAGDAASDLHTIKGTWHHTDVAGTANYFRVDGSSGRVGIGALPDATHALKVGGAVEITGTLTPNLIDVLTLSTAASEGVASDVLPDSGAVRSLGSTSRRWSLVATHDLNVDDSAGRGVANNLVPTAGGTWNLGESGRPWNFMYVNNLSLASDFVPNATDTQNIGENTTPLRWNELWALKQYNEVNFHTQIIGGNPTFTLDTDTTEDDQIRFVRASNRLEYRIDGTVHWSIDAAEMKVEGDALPAADVTYNSGNSAGNAWLGTYSQDLYVDSLSELGTGNDITVNNDLLAGATVNIGASGTFWNNAYVTRGYFGDTDHRLLLSTSDPQWLVDTNDYCLYDRSADQYQWVISNIRRMTLISALTPSRTQLLVGSLTSAPIAESGIYVGNGSGLTNTRVQITNSLSESAILGLSDGTGSPSFDIAYDTLADDVTWSYNSTGLWKYDSGNDDLSPVNVPGPNFGNTTRPWNRVISRWTLAIDTSDPSPASAQEATAHTGLNCVLATGSVALGSLNADHWNVASISNVSTGVYDITLDQGVDAENYHLSLHVISSETNTAYTYQASRQSATVIRVTIWKITGLPSTPAWALIPANPSFTFAVFGRPDGL